MSGLKMYGAKPKRMYTGGLKAKKAYCMGERVWSAGNIVTYICNGVSYQEEVEDGNTVLSPTAFTPALSGATLLGWSLSPDDSTVQTSLVMDGEPITLYAVFKYVDKSASLSYPSGTGGKEISSAYIQYNMALYSAAKIAWNIGAGAGYGSVIIMSGAGAAVFEKKSSGAGQNLSGTQNVSLANGMTYQVRVFGYAYAYATLTFVGKTIVG